MNSYRSLAALLCAGALAACGKEALQNITGTPPGASVKFFNFGVNAPGVNFYANDTKMTAISSTTGSESTTGTAYGGVGNGGLYAGIEPGQYTLSGRIAAATGIACTMSPSAPSRTTRMRCITQRKALTRRAR